MTKTTLDETPEFHGDDLVTTTRGAMTTGRRPGWSIKKRRGPTSRESVTSAWRVGQYQCRRRSWTTWLAKFESQR